MAVQTVKKGMMMCVCVCVCVCVRVCGLPLKGARVDDAGRL